MELSIDCINSDTGDAIIMQFDLDIGGNERLSTQKLHYEHHWKQSMQLLMETPIINAGEKIEIND